MKRSRYVIQTTGMSRCPGCSSLVDLLTKDSGSQVKFYICWACRRIFQIGVGEVPRASKEGDWS